MDKTFLAETLRAALVKSVELLNTDLPTSQHVDVLNCMIVLIGYGLEFDAGTLENLPQVEAKS